jgi:D-glycero-D-manno-heptose 1,7-bisphosphate phosphatase
MGCAAIFLDRDGTILESTFPGEYVTPRNARFQLGSLRALRLLAAEPSKVVIVSNQAGVASGAMTDDEANAVDAWMSESIRADGGRLDSTFYCKHGKQVGCICRKPNPGIFFDAAQLLDLDLQESWMIGDALTDYQAAVAAGLGAFVHVGTGRGALDRPHIIGLPGRRIPVVLAQDLLEAVMAMTGWSTRERLRLALHGVSRAYP